MRSLASWASHCPARSMVVGGNKRVRDTLPVWLLSHQKIFQEPKDKKLAKGGARPPVLPLEYGLLSITLNAGPSVATAFNEERLFAKEHKAIGVHGVLDLHAVEALLPIY